VLRRELSAVRAAIEEQQGRLKRWDKETEFSTILVSLTARKDYVAPTSPAFGATVARTFGGSVEALVNFGKFLLLIVVALTPWLPVFVAPALVGWFMWRNSVPRPIADTRSTPNPPPSSERTN
jgi:hypothetical protein